MPKVSVIFPVYNGAKFIRTSIRSILTQTFSNFELLLLNDGSTDDSLAVMQEFQDERIRIISNESNKGLIFTLNRGIEEAKGEYLARMDADDESFPERFRKQVHYLDSHTDVALCGTLMTCFITDRVYQHRYFNPEDVSASLVFTNPIVHPSVMMRRSIFNDAQFRYHAAYPHAEDYALWTQLAGKFKIAVLNEVLIRYGAHDDQMSRKFNAITRTSVIQAHQTIFNYLKIVVSKEEQDLHALLFFQEFRNSNDFVANAEKWLLKLVAANETAKVFSSESFEKIAGEWWFRIHQHLAPFGSGSYSEYKRSTLASFYKPETKALMKLRIKSILKTKA
jgi:glycosyltransferase involved in cell wall biosynthesis